MHNFFRGSNQGVVDVATSQENSSPFCLEDMSGAILLIPSDASSGSMTFFVSDKEFGDYLPLHANDTDAILSMTFSAGAAKELPPNLFYAHWVRFVVSAVGSNTKFKVLGKA